MVPRMTRAPARLHRPPAQGRLPQAAAPDRGPGPRPAADGRGGEVLHRHPHPGLRDDQGAAVGRARPARRAPRATAWSTPRGPAAPRPRSRSRKPPTPSPASSGPDHTTPERAPMSDTRTYTVTGMTCGHCVASVTEEVQEIPGVENVDVVLETGARHRHQQPVPRRRRRARRRRGGRLPAGMKHRRPRSPASSSASASCSRRRWASATRSGPVADEPVAHDDEHGADDADDDEHGDGHGGDAETAAEIPGGLMVSAGRLHPRASPTHGRGPGATSRSRSRSRAPTAAR